MIETFAPLSQIPFIEHFFTLRGHTGDFESPEYATAEQTHGNGVAVVSLPGRVAGVDALVTAQRGLPLVIRCADCPTIFLVDRKTPAIALVHSGKKGTLANVVGETLKHIGADFAFISPSIGPCHYDMDLWTPIEQQLAGVAEIHNPRICTACHLDRYYSYRAEKGKTGKMFALLALR